MVLVLSHEIHKYEAKALVLSHEIAKFCLTLTVKRVHSAFESVKFDPFFYNKIRKIFNASLSYTVNREIPRLFSQVRSETSLRGLSDVKKSVWRLSVLTMVL